MAKELHMDWLLKQAGDKFTLEWLKKIRFWREYTLKNNEFIDNDHSFLLRLGSKSFRSNSNCV